jgi:hypothetical protein
MGRPPRTKCPGFSVTRRDCPQISPRANATWGPPAHASPLFNPTYIPPHHPSRAPAPRAHSSPPSPRITKRERKHKHKYPPTKRVMPAPSHLVSIKRASRKPHLQTIDESSSLKTLEPSGESQQKPLRARPHQKRPPLHPSTPGPASPPRPQTFGGHRPRRQRSISILPAPFPSLDTHEAPKPGARTSQRLHPKELREERTRASKQFLLSPSMIERLNESLDMIEKTPRFSQRLTKTPATDSWAPAETPTPSSVLLLTPTQLTTPKPETTSGPKEDPPASNSSAGTRQRLPASEIVAHQNKIYNDIQLRRYRAPPLPHGSPHPRNAPTPVAIPEPPNQAPTSTSHPDLPQTDGDESPNVTPPPNDKPGKDPVRPDDDSSYTSKIISATESITISDPSETSAVPPTPHPSPTARPRQVPPANNACTNRAFQAGTYLRRLLSPFVACIKSKRSRRDDEELGHNAKCSSGHNVKCFPRHRSEGALPSAVDGPSRTITFVNSPEPV